MGNISELSPSLVVIWEILANYLPPINVGKRVNYLPPSDVGKTCVNYLPCSNVGKHVLII
jgi:hypothetical protein